jgi:hypothetical protein
MRGKEVLRLKLQVPAAHGPGVRLTKTTPEKKPSPTVADHNFRNEAI